MGLRMTRTLVIVSLLFLGCSTQPAADSRSVSGQLSTALLAQLDNPAIVLRTADGEQRVARASRTGHFKLQVPVGKTVHLAAASTTAAGVLREESTIRWPGAWVRVEAGRPVELGVVRSRGASTAAAHPEGEHDGGVGDDDAEDDEDEGDEACGATQQARADLPYDAKIPLGAAYKLTDSFREKGALPAAILSVTMEGGGTWRLAELQADTTFTVTQSDCSHPGNRDTGRDRVNVTWRNADGSTGSDHLDLRYCEGSTPPSANARAASTSSSSEHCSEVCEDDEDNDDSECDSQDDDGLVDVPSGGQSAGTCTQATTPPVTPPGTGTAGTACVTSAECVSPLACFQSTCVAQIN
jgi:hypothetical protein